MLFFLFLAIRFVWKIFAAQMLKRMMTNIETTLLIICILLIYLLAAEPDET